MKNGILNISTLVAVLAFVSSSVQAQKGFGTNQPSKAAAIEMKSESKGLLIPRVELEALNDFAPIKGETATDVNKTNSLLVYNTATSNSPVAEQYRVTPGYYYWKTDGTNGSWNKLIVDSDIDVLHLAGDVTGALGDTNVGAIQGKSVSDVPPTANQILVWDATNEKWEPKAQAPQIFYMPAVIFDTTNPTSGTAKISRDLYQEYKNQFTGGPVEGYPIIHGANGYDNTNLYMGGLITNNKNTGTAVPIHIYDRNELNYYVTYYDTDVFADLEIDDDGNLSYRIIGTVSEISYMNIVFVVK